MINNLTNCGVMSLRVPGGAVEEVPIFEIKPPEKDIDDSKIDSLSQVLNRILIKYSDTLNNN